MKTNFVYMIHADRRLLHPKIIFNLNLTYCLLCTSFIKIKSKKNFLFICVKISNYLMLICGIKHKKIKF